MATVVVDRHEWLATRLQLRAPSLRLDHYQLHPANTGFKQFADIAVKGLQESVHIAPSTQYVLGGPDGFLLYALGLQASMDYRLSEGTSLVGGVNARLLDNYDKFRYTAPSNLPRVRTYQREYNTTSRLTLPFLQVNHMRSLGNGHFASVYGGMLEPMFGGVGTEWYYRPWLSRLGWGLDVNYVRQRSFKQDLSFRSYSVATGHLTAYWDTGIQGIHATASVGRYLAGDIGGTLDIKKVFDNGIALGAWATKTNVSKEQFGEGSFDKGIYINIPFDVMLPRSRPGSATIAWNPLTRDGGAKLVRRFSLNDVTKLRAPLNWGLSMPGPSASGIQGSLSVIDQDPAVHPLSDISQTTRTLGAQMASIPAHGWLLAGGAVLASALLDKPADRWATRHQGGTWNTAGNLTSAVPFLLAGGAGALYLGLAGAEHVTTAETAIRAAGYTLASGLALKYAVGRARPNTNLGAAQFNGFNGKALNSSFASIHTSVAFALATPFAQQYKQPWLYGLAATTALGRVQKRDHWVSDTVGGALLGYAIGSMLSQQQTTSGSPVSIQVTPNAVLANWKY
jgi:membrane-associated phospholipid phosphatase